MSSRCALASADHGCACTIATVVARTKGTKRVRHQMTIGISSSGLPSPFSPKAFRFVAGVCGDDTPPSAHVKPLARRMRAASAAAAAATRKSDGNTMIAPPLLASKARPRMAPTSAGGAPWPPRMRSIAVGSVACSATLNGSEHRGDRRDARRDQRRRHADEQRVRQRGVGKRRRRWDERSARV